MLTLVTSNPAKYAPFAADLERLRLKLEPPSHPLPEIQSLNFTETLTAKARAAAEMFGRPVIVDDTGLVLEAYPSFPGPLTATVIRSLGPAGLGRLLAGVSDRAVMQCHSAAGSMAPSAIGSAPFRAASICPARFATPGCL